MLVETNNGYSVFENRWVALVSSRSVARATVLGYLGPLSVICHMARK